jgi:hypothetical protein
MDIEFTQHAEQRIAGRKLDRAQIVEVARAPEQIVRRENRPPVAQSRVMINNKQVLLRVPFEDYGDTRLVLTVYYTVSIKRYWQGELDED